MTKSQHTPRPWHVYQDTVRSANDETICIPGIKSCSVPAKQIEPNMTLIATVPNLLFELEMNLIFMIELKKKHLNRSEIFAREILEKRIADTTFAIAEARGDLWPR